jgi:hypothetical protein
MGGMSGRSASRRSWPATFYATFYATLYAALAVSPVVISPIQADEPVHFDQQVRPILSDACSKCHGPDAGHYVRRDRRLRL